jgi:hypothetical protein
MPVQRQNAAMISASRLLNSIDALPYGARQRRLAARARDMAGTAELTALLDDLHAQGGFARKIALHLAYVGGEPAYVERCLGAEETEVVGTALGLAVRMRVAPERLVGLVPGLSTAMRRKLYGHVRRRKAVALAEALLPVVRDRFGDHEAAVLLPVCDAGTIAAHLPGLAYAVTGWRALGHRHPQVFLDWLDDELAGSSSGWQDLITTTAGALVAAAQAEPDRVLAVLTLVAPRVSLPRQLNRAWAVLARHDPARLLDFLVDPRRKDDHAPRGRRLWRALFVTSDEDLVRFGRAMPTGALADFLRQLPPARRPAVYAGVVGTREEDDWIAPLIDRLPVPARAAEAERLLTTRAVADDPSRRLRITARLPWATARETLYAATRRSTAEERAEAYRCLVTAAAGSRDQEVFAAVVSSLDRLPNEQDPVRAAAFGELARVPAWLFRPAEAPTLLEMMTDALTARDCSFQTQISVRTLITNLVRHGALTGQLDLVEAGITALRRLGQLRPWLDLSGLNRNLPRGGEHRVFEALRPRIAEDARYGRFEVALSLARGLGRRAWDMPELQGFVDRARTATDDQTVRTAIGLWLAPWRTRDERLGEVFHADRSTITIPEVLNGIAFSRTDLVDEVLTKPLHGRFLKRGVKYAPGFAGCFHRWLPRQCEAYADRLAKVAGKDTKQAWEQVWAISRLARVPGTAARLRRYLAHQKVAVVEAALGGLAWTDEPAGVLPELLSYVDTDRARVAVYAATRCARFVPPALLGEALAKALHSKKVTSRKEAVRLLAGHRAPDVAGLLHTVWQRPDEHRDVRRAIVSAARWCLDDERTWSLLESAAGSEHAVATALLDLDPRTIAPAHRPRYAALVRAVADADDTDTARLGLTTMSRWARWDAAGTDMLVRRVTDLANTATWHQSMTALFAACDATADPAPLVTAASTLLAAPEPESTADRDLPARQRLLALTDAIRLDGTGSETIRAAAARLADVLSDRTLRRTAISLAAAAVTFEDEAPLVRLAALADEPLWAWHAHSALADVVGAKVSRLPQAYLHDLAAGLATRSPAAVLLALAIAAAAGAESGWPTHWRELVAGLRTHDHPDVRLAALDTFTSREV